MSLWLFVAVLSFIPVCLSVPHSTNWALIVGTSRYWFNYRHVANPLSIYHTVKSMGIPDSQIILMLADDMACNPRNSFAGQVFNSLDHSLNLYSESIEVDYRGSDCTVENFLRVLTGRHPVGTPLSRQLLTDRQSNLLIYMTGHGGDEFLKFQDSEELTSKDLADAFFQMHLQERYNEILFVSDTCQAATLHKQFYAPNVLSIGSSKLGQNSYSHVNDDQVGVSLVDRFTNFALEFFQHRIRKRTTLQDWFVAIPPSSIMSEPEWRYDLFNRSIGKARINDFFASVNPIQLVHGAYPLESSVSSSSLPSNSSHHSTSVDFESGADATLTTTQELLQDQIPLASPYDVYLLVMFAAAVIFLLEWNSSHSRCLQ